MLHGIASCVVLREYHRNGDVYNIYIYIHTHIVLMILMGMSCIKWTDGCSIAMFDYRRVGWFTPRQTRIYLYIYIVGRVYKPT